MDYRKEDIFAVEAPWTGDTNDFHEILTSLAEEMKPRPLKCFVWSGEECAGSLIEIKNDWEKNDWNDNTVVRRRTS